MTTGPAAALARTALSWRHTPPEPQSKTTLDVIERGLLPIYRIFLDDYEIRLRDYGRVDLAEALSAWRKQLASP